MGHDHEDEKRASSLPQLEAEYLAEYGGLPDPEIGPGSDQYQRLVAEQAAVDRARFMTIGEAAHVLGIDETAVLVLIENGEIVANHLDGQSLFPRWQFAPEGKLLPRLPEIVRLLRADMSPYEIAGKMATPQPDLAIDGPPLTPAEWLAAGHPLQSVADLLQTDIEW